MGFWDNSWEGLSVVSSSRKHHGRHHSSTGKFVRKKSRSRSRSRSSSRHRHHSSHGLSATAAASGLAASIFGADSHHHGDSHHHRHSSTRGSFFGLPNISKSSFFGISMSTSRKGHRNAY
jgi:hypothetical protein